MVETLRGHNPNATIITTDWDALSGAQILAAMEKRDTIEEALHHLEEEHEHHHHHDHDEDCCCGHHHDHDHDHDHEEHEHEHHHDHEHHHHDHDDHCCCGHDHEGHHHADDVFESVGIETPKKFTKEKIEKALEALEDKDEYGFILRAKGIVEAEDGQWIHFDYVPGEPDVRTGASGVTGRLCVIGSEIDRDKILKLFEI